MPRVERWTIPGSEALPLLGDAHIPAGPVRACAVLLHGYLGYKDYGLLPVLAERLCGRGVLVHRFNFAHSGMTNAIERFERVDLFERQTWNAQVYDTLCVLDAVRGACLPGSGGPLVLIGHSRGGVTALLTAGRHGARAGLAGVVTLATPAACCSLEEPARTAWLAAGRTHATSNRTGQTMPISSAWLEEQIADPQGHDLLFQASRVRVPVLCVHGSADETVDPDSAGRIVEAVGAHARAVGCEGGNHVFGMPNPPDPAGGEGAAFRAMREAVEGFILDCADNR